MLSLMRRVGQSFTIGKNIKIIVYKVHPGPRVILSIQAPKDLAILRDDAVKREKPENVKSL